MDVPGARWWRPSRSAVRLGTGLILAVLLLERARRIEDPADVALSDAGAPGVSRGPECARTEPGNLTLPSGAVPGIDCSAAQRVSSFVHRELAVPVIEPLPNELGRAWADLLDPHGLWSAAPDSPLVGELNAAAPELLEVLRARAAGCSLAPGVARTFEAWLTQLTAVYDAAFDAARSESISDDALFQLVAEPLFENDPVTRPAQELARQLGMRLGAFAARFPAENAMVEQARARFFPSGLETLSRILLLAGLRAYVPLVDPHGAFAPLDEEWSLYAGDATLDGGSLLWAAAERTPLGARVVDAASPPLQVDDLVLSIAGLSLAGASLDQIEQACRSAPAGAELDLRVLRQGEPELLSLVVGNVAEPTLAELELERIPDGQHKEILRVVVPDVGDWLGEELAHVLENDARTASAVLLDLRGNGGGSLDAAVEALGLMLPGAPLFPLIRRGLVSEVLRAPRPTTVYTGPVAALVDGDTASAAEMIAGGLQAYARGSVVGARTFGKGCVQEYFDDVAPAGVLRLTTLQFAMPSGKPLQQIGLSPDLPLPLAPALERESEITRQPITFDGPDVRDRGFRRGPAWPRSTGAPGPCRDPVVCSALSRLAGVQSPRAARGRGSRAP